MYGTGTRSYNRSPERREMKRIVAEATAKFVPNPESVEIRWSMCTCRSFRLPHDPKDHNQGPKKLLSDHDWRSWEERRDMQLYDERVR